MDVENLAKELILKNMTPEQQMAVLDSVRQSVLQAKEVQKRKIGENVDLVVQALKKIESDIRSRFDDVGNAIEKRVASIQDGRDGINGKDGRDGKDGKSGRDGAKGDKGDSGRDGRDGVDGVDGISVTSARIDFDGSLVITLSSGVELNVGEVVAPDLAERIKVITNGGGTSQSVLDTLASLQTQITNLIPSQTGNSGKYLTTNGTALSWASVAGGLTYQGTWNATTNTPTLTSSVGTNGYYYIVATAGSTNLNGITDWQIGDWLMFNGSVWQKIDQSNLVTSVNGQTGAVSVGTVTSVTGTSPVASSGGATPVISLEASYGDTQNPYASKTAKFVLAAPNASAGVPTFRAIVASDIPTLNQSTTGSAATLTTPRAIYGNNFDGSAALTQVIASTYGGTGNGFTKFTGATTAEKTYTLPDASSTIVVQGGALGTPSSGTVTNLTGTASININGTVGATTASSGAFTTLSATGVTTVQAGTAALPAITTTGDTNTGIFFPAADTVGVSTGGSERARVDSSGNVGIGTSSPTRTLDVSAASATVFVTSSTGTNRVYYGTSNTGGVTYFGRENSAGSTFGTTAYSSVVWSEGAYPLVFATNNTERMRIDSSGNLLLGTTTNPDNARLRVYGIAEFDGAGVSLINFKSSGTAIGALGQGNYVVTGGGTTNYGFSATNALVFGSGGSTERMRITSAGGISFGSSGTAYGTSGQVLTSNGNAAPTWNTLSVAPAAVSDQNNTSTGYFDLPSGTTAQRPASPTVGMIRYNTTESKYEVYTGTVWQFITSNAYSYSVDYLVIAGGAGGGGRRGGGGGAGGFKTATGLALAGGTTYTITVGAGGAGGSGISIPDNSGSNGTNSVFNSITSTGGGGAAGEGQGAGKTGGSGGGGSNGAGGSGTSGQGSAGGSGSNSAPNYAGGGGGGASSVGANGTSTTGGNGGAGTASSITGSSITYAGGGGGGTYQGGTAGSGGSGGGGGGGTGGTDNNGTAGTANLGGGGGGGSIQADLLNRAGGAGGSGVVIISIPTSNYSGTTTGSPTVTTSGSNTILKYTGSGTYTA